MIRSAVTLLLILAPTLGFAHGGGLDANGCHTNRKTGDYHCHRAPTAPSSSGTVTTPRAPVSTTSKATPLYSQSQPATTPGKVLQGVATERELVLTAQLLLLALGYSPGEPDGMLTNATTTAIKQFQADRSLNQDGLIKGSLLVRLSEQVAPSRGDPPPSRLAQFGEPDDRAGADLVSDWFRRNMRIYTNIVQLADSPDERVLVIFGAGHLGWLQHGFASNPNFRLRKLADFAR